MVTEKKPTLEYEPRTAAMKGSAGVMAGIGRVAGLLLGIFGAVTLLCGGVGLGFVIYHDVIQHRGGVNTAGDFYEVVIVLVIGLFSTFFAVRWIRSSGAVGDRQEADAGVREGGTT